jgi:hypothetical protein
MRTIIGFIILHLCMLLLLMTTMQTKESRKGLQEAAHLMVKNIP